MKKNTAKDVMQPHSEAKVAFYRAYLRRFLAIMSKNHYFDTVNIFDIFCGRGVYSDGGLGSPIRAVEAICEARQNYPSKVRFRLFLNDKVKEFVKRVQTYIQENYPKTGCEIHYLNMPANELMDQLAYVLNNTKKTAKNLLFIDPYGYKEIHRTTFEELLINGRTEIMLFLPISFMHRFTHYAFDEKAAKSALPLRQFISEFFDRSHPIQHDAPMPVRQYVDELAEAFSFGGRYYTTSYLIDRDSHNRFALFFITPHQLGLEKAIEAMWELDQVEGKGFHLPADPEMPRLFDDRIFIENRHREQMEQLRMVFVGNLQQRQLTNNYIYNLTLRSGFLPKHANEVMRSLQDDGLIDVLDTKTGRSARKNTFYLYERDAGKNRDPKVVFRLKQ